MACPVCKCETTLDALIASAPPLLVSRTLRRAQYENLGRPPCHDVCVRCGCIYLTATTLDEVRRLAAEVISLNGLVSAAGALDDLKPALDALPD